DLPPSPPSTPPSTCTTPKFFGATCGQTPSAHSTPAPATAAASASDTRIRFPRVMREMIGWNTICCMSLTDSQHAAATGAGSEPGESAATSAGGPQGGPQDRGQGLQGQGGQTQNRPGAYPETVERLITEFARLPGIGRRSAERLAFWTL